MSEYLPLLGFVFFGLFSPGPNVILLTASGARFGFRRTMPHVVGVALGVGVIAGTTSLGVGALLQAQPALTLILKIVAFFWILWMAWGLWQAKPVSARQAGDRPFTFVEAVLFQATALALSFSGINLFVCFFWTAAGAALSFLLTNPAAWRIFLRMMAVALVFFSVLVFL